MFGRLWLFSGGLWLFAGGLWSLVGGLWSFFVVACFSNYVSLKNKVICDTKNVFLEAELTNSTTQQESIIV